MFLVLFVFLPWISLLLCLRPCFVLRSVFPHVHMFRSTCLWFYVMFFYVLFLFLLYVDVRVTCSHAWYHVYGYVLDLHVCMHVLCSFVYIQVFTCLYAWIHVLPCLCAKFLHVYMYVPMPICLYLCFHMLVCLDLYSLHVSCYFQCACALYATFACLALGHVCHDMCYCSPLVTFSL